jgi:hypothetical protein
MGEMMTEWTGVRIIVREGWDGAGRKGEALGEPVHTKQDWLPVKWDDEDDPNFVKLAGVMPDIDPVPEIYGGMVEPYLKSDWFSVCALKQRSDEWKDGFNYGMNVLSFWMEFQLLIGERSNIPEHRVSIGMSKSRLLRRLLMGEQLRKKPCPIHKGRMSTFGDCDLCQGTGWRPNDDDEIAQGRKTPYSDLGPYFVKAE